METVLKFRRILKPVLWAVLALFLLKYLLPLALPVVLGVSAAGVLSPLIRRVRRVWDLRYGTAAALSVTGVLLGLLLILWAAGQFLLSGLSAMSRQLPEMVSALSRQLTRLSQWVEGFSDTLPAGAGDAFRVWSQGLTSSGGSLPSELYEGIFSLVSGFLGSLPDNLLFLLTMVLSCYFAAGELPRLAALLREHLPRGRWQSLLSLGASMKTVLGSWIRAQLKLMGVTFLILLVGFLLLRVKLPLFLALGISLLDALPLFGTGAVLLPWGLMSMVTGEMHLGLGIMLLYGTAALCRNVLEPKLLGAQMGVSPLLTLLAIYVGYRISGFWGMVLLPILVMLTAEVLEARHRPEPIPEPSKLYVRPVVE